MCGLLIAWNMLIDVYSFDEDGVLTRRPLGVRVRRVAWSDVRSFENRGFRPGAGAWLNDGRWLKLRGIALIDKAKADREVALLEYVRQQPPRAVGTGTS